MDNELQKQTEDALNSLFDALNKMGGEDQVQKGLEQVLGRQHRTLQQNYFRHIVVPSINIFAEKKSSGNFDLRNEASCALAGKLNPLVKDEGLPFI